MELGEIELVVQPLALLQRGVARARVAREEPEEVEVAVVRQVRARHPPRRDGDRRRRHVLHGMPPPRRIDEYVAGYETRAQLRDELVERELVGRRLERRNRRER